MAKHYRELNDKVRGELVAEMQAGSTEWTRADGAERVLAAADELGIPAGDIWPAGIWRELVQSAALLAAGIN